MRRLKDLIYVISGLGVGLFVGYFGRQLLTINFNKELKLSDLISFLTTLVVALILGNYLKEKHDIKTNEKDLLISDIKEIRLYTEQARELFYNSYQKKKLSAEDSTAIKRLLRNLSINLSTLSASLNQCQDTVGNIKVDEIKNLYLEYKSELTGGSFPAKPYTGDTFNEAERVYLELRSKIQTLIYEVNRK